MGVVNVFNHNRKVFVFKRNSNGKLSIESDDTFMPFYYEPSVDGQYTSYDGIKLQKIQVSQPYDIKKNASSLAYGIDIPFVKNYITHKLGEFGESSVRYCIIDIEVLCKEMPDKDIADLPISSITCYDNFGEPDNDITQFYLGDYKYKTCEKYNEARMLEDFIAYLKEHQFDFITAWNVSFDYTYLFNRINKVLNKNFATEISPVGLTRYGEDNCDYPNGTSIVDYMGLFRKVNGKETHYTLDHILTTYIGEGKTYKKVDFSILSEELKARNREDVTRMVVLESKLKLVPYYNEIRKLCKCQWEDLPMKISRANGRLVTISNNSKLIDSLLLEEAKVRNIVLPNKARGQEKIEYEGAFREAYETGRFVNVGKYDLTSAYPFAMIDFCLDPVNIVKENTENAINIDGTWFLQNEDALLVSVVRKTVGIKFDIAKQMKNAAGEELNNLIMKYAAIKGVVNSAYGAIANPYFRLYEPRIASSTTFLVRSLLHYVVDKINELDGFKVIYVDTDSVFIQDGTNLLDRLNLLIKEWGKLLFNKDNVTILFEYEGVFEKLVIIALCRYKGYVIKPNGKTKVEETGIEAKRKDSSKFMVEFQTTLLEMIMDGKGKEEVMVWIEKQKKEIKLRDLIDVSFPCKMSAKTDDYKNTPIFVRASHNSKLLFDWFPRMGDPFYYTFLNLKGKGYGGKVMDVIAFDSDVQHKVNKDLVNWDEIINRNITSKYEKIFGALGWTTGINLFSF